MSIQLDGQIKEVFIPELNQKYAAPSELQMLDMCDNIVEGICATGQRFSRIGSINDGASSWVEYVAGRLRSARVLDDSERTGGVGKIAPLALRHYHGEEGGRLKDVTHYAAYSAQRRVFVGQNVAGIDKVVETGETQKKFGRLMRRYQARSSVFATMVSKIPPEQDGPEIYGHLTSSDTWYIFPPQRPGMIRSLGEKLASKEDVTEAMIRDILVELFAPQNNDELRRLLRFLPRVIGSEHRMA